MLSDEQHTMASVRRADDLTVLDTASRQTANSDRMPLHFVTKLPRWTLSSPRQLMLDMAFTSSTSELGSSSMFTNDCVYEKINQKSYAHWISRFVQFTCIVFINKASTSSLNIWPNADTSLRTIFLLPRRRLAWILNFSETSTKSMQSSWPCSGNSLSWSQTKSIRRPVNVWTDGPKLSGRHLFSSLFKIKTANPQLLLCYTNGITIVV